VVLPLETNAWFAAGYATVVAGSVIYGFGRMYLRVRGLGSNPRDLRTDGARVLNFLESAEGENVLPLPFGMSFHLLYETDLNILFHQNPKISFESVFPVPIVPLEDIAREFSIDYVLVDTIKLDVAQFDIEPFKIAFEDSGYLVLALDRDDT
jgi:hypothetical protein